MKKILGRILLAAILCMESVSVFAAQNIKDPVDRTAGSVWSINKTNDTDTIDGSAENNGGSNSAQNGQFAVNLYRMDGSVYKTVYSRKGKIKLPTLANPKGYTFMGWSRRPGKTVNPEYEAGDTVSVMKETSFYPVMFDRSTEPDLSRKDITVPKGYDQIIFVGDSRTYALSKLLEQEFGDSLFKKVSFVSKTGSTLSWLKGTGRHQLLNLLEANKKNGKYVKTAVIFNHGVNSLKHYNGSNVNVNRIVNNYCTYMKKLAPKLKNRNCDLYYMSVNPVNTGKKDEATLRKGEEVRQFNEGIRKGLKGTYDYINTYGYLVKNGYGTASKLVSQDKDDGTHYTYATYKRIFAYCMNYLSKKTRR